MHLRLIAFTALLLSAAPGLAEDRCEAIGGTEEQLTENRKQRERSLVDVHEQAGNMMIVHSDPRFDAPETVRLDGIEIVGVEDGAVVAVLSEPLQELCGVEQITLGVDDSLGRAYQIVHVDDEGALLMANGRLAWWGSQRDVEPDFQMVWRSPFAVEMATKAKPKKRKRPVRRKRRR